MRRFAWVLVTAACSGEPAERDAEPTPAPAAADCPRDAIAVTEAPDVRPEQREAAHWLQRLGAAADEVVLDANAVAALDRAATTVEGAWRDVLVASVGEPSAIAADLAKRHAWIRERAAAGKYVPSRPDLVDQAVAVAEAAQPIDELHVLVAETQARCIPTREHLFSGEPFASPPPPDPAFDRNYCSSLHPAELVRALRRSADDRWFLVHAGHSIGWVETPAWTPALPPTEARAFRDAAARVFVLADDLELGGVRLRLGAELPLVGRSGDALRVRLPTLRGLEEVTWRPVAGVASERPPLTRRRLFELALAQLDAPYGWGGHAGGRDCSSFLYDLFSAFGLRLGRHSSVQAQLGSRSISLAGLDEPSKRDAIRRAAAVGIVLLHMPGHVMLYLGQDGDTDYAVSSLSEYLVPCPGGPDTMYRLDRVAVTTLDLGRGSERTSFIERIDRMAVFGG